MSTISGKFVGPEEIRAALTDVAAEVKRDKLRAVLVGGCALQLYGSTRLTVDVDLAADRYPDPLGALPAQGVLTFGGIKTITKSGVPVDFIVRDDQYAPLYEAAIDAARRITGVPVPVATLPYLGAMKLASGRLKDIQDLEFILRETDVSYKKLRALVVEYLDEFEAEALDSLKSTIDWQKAKKP